ncbi:Uncharacterised protein [Escherichia coli]|nr:hypothetical protein L476_00548 [Escherichia coli BIDMC 39]STG96563.1 Uncharacterised protein [Escherichia coli]
MKASKILNYISLNLLIGPTNKSTKINHDTVCILNSIPGHYF